MRTFALALFTITIAAACGDNKGANPDAPVTPHPDGPQPDGADVPDGIAGARMAGDGTGLSLPIHHVVVTYLKPAIGNATNDPAGFTIQAAKDGPGLFIAVDPATLTPVPVVGNVVDFTITTMGTVGMQRRAQAIDGFTKVSAGFDVTTLATDISAATDVVTNLDGYDSRLVNVTGTAATAFASSGSGFQRTNLDTAGITGDANFQLRAPTTLVDAIDMVSTCGISAHAVPMGRFNAAAEVGVFVSGDLTLTGCPAPTVVSAIALSDTTAKFTFSRNIDPTSVTADGSQFTFDNGLTASAATVSGRTVTVTTSTQTGGTTYTATVANTVTDLQGTALGNSGGSFAGFIVLAHVRINEFNASITGGCDLIELRVTESGSMGAFKITERNGGSGELTLTFPAGFQVAKNDFVVVHLNGPSATCNPGTGTQETTSKTEQPHATFGANFDTAFDFYASDTGLTGTDNVLTLFDATGAIIDAVFASNDPAATSTAGATLTAAAVVGTANQWQPAQATYTATEFRTNAVDDLDAPEMGTGNSIQRVDDADTNAKADWTTGAGVASSWGAKNPGQNDL